MLTEILGHMDLASQVAIREDSEERVVLNVQGDDVGRIIGKKGQTLDALQFIITKSSIAFPKGGATCYWIAGTTGSGAKAA